MSPETARCFVATCPEPRRVTRRSAKNNPGVLEEVVRGNLFWAQLRASTSEDEMPALHYEYTSWEVSGTTATEY